MDKAFHATLLVLDHRSSDARLLFEEAIRDLNAIERPSERERYILNYCRYYETMIGGGDGEKFRSAAEDAPVDQSMRRQLPLTPAGAIASSPVSTHGDHSVRSIIVSYGRGFQ